MATAPLQHSASRRHRSARPLLEALEPRALLATFTVTVLADSGPGSIREAIEQANLGPDRDTIAFAPGLAGTIGLTTALPDLSTSMILDGPGAAVLAVAGDVAAPTFRIFTVSDGVEVSISGLTISNGRAHRGGGIDNQGTLTISGATLSRSLATHGGGIANSGRLTLIDSTVTENQAYGFSSLGGGVPAFGGGISSSGVLTVVNSIIGNNKVVGGSSFGHTGSPGASGIGGGIHSIGTLTIVDSTLDGNAATGGNGWGGAGGPGLGGAIYSDGIVAMSNTTLSSNEATGGVMGLGAGGGLFAIGGQAISLSTFSGNAATGDDGWGGAIYSDGTLDLTNATLGGNSARPAPGFDSSSSAGGGIFGLGTLRIRHVTLVGNDARTGGGISVGHLSTDPAGGGFLQVVATILANNTGGNVAVLGGRAESLGHNLVSGPPGFPLSPTDRLVADAALGPLSDNGGPTRTFALRPSSPAIDAAGLVAGVATDQRGVPRPQGVAPDIGAFELEEGAIPLPSVVGLGRRGIHSQPTRLMVSFNVPMDAARAGDLANYRLVDLGRDRLPGTADDRPVPLDAATYDAALRSVTLSPRRRLPLRGTYRLTVVGTPPGGLTSASGVPLDGVGAGQPGSDFVATFGREALVRPETTSPAGRLAEVRRRLAERWALVQQQRRERMPERQADL